MKRALRHWLLPLVLVALPGLAHAELMIIGIDEKQHWDEAGKMSLAPPGKDVVAIVDITNREAPRIVATLPLMNTVIGPPVNLVITRDERLALVANSMKAVQDGAAWKLEPDTKLWVIDLKAEPPRLIATLDIGKQPSGIALSPGGDLALVANRADQSVSVLAIQGMDVKLIDTVPIGEQVASLVFTPDGKHVLVTKFAGHKIAVLDVAGQKVTYGKYDMPVGLWPYNVDVAPGGKIALTADNGNAGGSDGHVDTVSVIDLEANPLRVIDRVVVGDAPEGLAISPTGGLAVAILLNGSAAVPKTAWFANPRGKVAVLRIDDKKVTKVGEVEVGGLPEGVVWSSDGKYVYVGNYTTKDVSILKVDGGTVTDTGKRLALPGQPASMRGRAR